MRDSSSDKPASGIKVSSWDAENYLISGAQYGGMEASMTRGTAPSHHKKEAQVAENELSPEERNARGKRLLAYGMFSLVLVTLVTLFLVLWFWLTPWGASGDAVKITLIIGAVAVIACVIVWFVYTKLILKE